MNPTLSILRRSAAVFALGAFALSTASAQTLLLDYNFDEANGDAIDHGASPATNGTFEGAASRISGGPSGSGSALDLTGGSAYVDAGDNNKFDGLGQFTITGWMNLQADPGNNRILSKQAGGSFDGISFHVDGTASDFGVRMFLGGGTGFAFDTVAGSFDADNKWLFFAATYDGTSSSNNANYYSGNAGTSVGLSHTSTINAGPINDNTSRMMIGRTDAAPAASTNINGYLDDVRIYSGALDATQLETVRLANIPEPSTYAAIFGGLALVAVGARRFRRNRA